MKKFITDNIWIIAIVLFVAVAYLFIQKRKEKAELPDAATPVAAAE